MLTSPSVPQRILALFPLWVISGAHGANHNIPHESYYVVVGVGKAGTSSIDHVAQCLGMNTSHWMCPGSGVRGMSNFGQSCGRCVVESVLDQVSIPQRCGPKVQMFSQTEYVWDLPRQRMGSKVPTCFAPFFHYAKQLRDLNPSACFLLNTRPWEDHLRSLRNWIHMDQMFLHACQIVPATDEGFFNWMDQGYRSIRESFNGSCFLELDVTQANRSQTVQSLASFMRQDVAKMDACWQVMNKNKLHPTSKTSRAEAAAKKLVAAMDAEGLAAMEAAVAAAKAALAAA